MNNKLIAIFGGAFNPPTVAHYEVTKHLLSLPFIKKVFLMPVGDHYDKPGLAPAEHRLEMLRMMVKDLPKAKASDLEVIANRALKTVETLEILQILNEGKEFAFVMGADNLRELPNWSQHEKLIKNFKMIIFNRGEFDVQSLITDNFSKYQNNFIVIDDFAKLDISATQYRENPPTEDLLLPEVTDYIEKHGLYRRFYS